MQHTSSDSGFELESERGRRRETKERSFPRPRDLHCHSKRLGASVAQRRDNFIAACRGEAQHVTRSLHRAMKDYGVYSLQVPICRRNQRVVWVIAGLLSLIGLKVLEYCSQFARRLLFAGYSTTWDFNSRSFRSWRCKCREGPVV
jgi:hypothetical protein